MSTIIDIPLNGGQDEGTDRLWLPDGKFRALQNCRLTRDGRLEVRPAYTSLGNTSVSAAGARFYAYDVAPFQDQLVAMGTTDSVSFTPDYQRQLFTYIGSQGWAPQNTSQSDQLSCVSELKTIFQAPYGNVMSNSDVAYTNGYVCVCTTDAESSVGGTIYIIDATTGVVVAQQRNGNNETVRCCAVGNTFVVIIRAGGSLYAQRLDTANISAGLVGDTLIAASSTLADYSWDLSAYSSTQFLLSYAHLASTSMVLSLWNASSFAAAVATRTIAAKAGDSAVIGDATHGIVWAFRDGNDVELRTLNASLTVTVGPTDVLGPSATTASGSANVLGAPALGFVSATHVTVQAANSGSLGIEDSVYTTRSLAAHAESAGARNGNVNIRSKLYTQERSSTLDGCFGVGVMIASGNTSGTDQSYTDCINGVEDGHYCAGTWNYGVADKMTSAATIVTPAALHGRSSVATDGAGTFWAAVGVVDASSVFTADRGTLQLVQFKSGVSQRRQAAEMQGALYVAGGFTYYYDRGVVPSESGFLDVPVIKQITQGTSGSLTQLATYRYVAVYEWQDTLGRTHRSAPSFPFTVTLTGTNDETFPQVSTPRSLRRAALFSDGNAVKIVLYRTTPNDSVFFRVCETTAAGSSTYADVANANDRISDTVAQTRPILYTQSQKPTYNIAMQACRFVAAGRDRLIFGGLADPYLVTLTQLSAPGEPMESASPNLFAYQARLPEAVTAVEAFGDSYIVFTRSGVYSIPGTGPMRNGQGEFFSPQTLYADGGCIDWRSVVSCGQGTFFQLAADKLYILRPGGGAEWIGQPVRDTLATYPTITGACLCSETQRVVFSCTNTAGDAGVLLIYDLRRNIWTVDTVGPVKAVAEYDGRLAYVLSGLVYLEDSAIAQGAGALPTVSVRTGSVAPFGRSGAGTLCEAVLQGTYLGDSTIEGFVSYDDGVTWTSMGSHPATAANLVNPVSGSAVTSGDPITLSWTPKQREVDRFALRFDVTNATNTGGSRLHGISLEVETTGGLVRLPARNRR